MASNSAGDGRRVPPTLWHRFDDHGMVEIGILVVWNKRSESDQMVEETRAHTQPSGDCTRAARGIDKIAGIDFAVLAEAQIPSFTLRALLAQSLQRLIDIDRDAATCHGAAKVIVEAFAIDVPEMAIVAEDAVLRPLRGAPSRALFVSGDVARRTKAFPKSERCQRLSNGPAKGFPAPTPFRGRPVEYDAGQAQIGEPGPRGGTGRPGAKYADVTGFLHLWVPQSATS